MRSCGQIGSKRKWADLGNGLAGRGRGLPPSESARSARPRSQRTTRVRLVGWTVLGGRAHGPLHIAGVGRGRYRQL